MTCGGNTLYGGRRRKSGRKSSKKTLKRKMRGGVMYGPTEAIAPGAIAWGGVDTSAPVDPVTGGKVPDPFSTSPNTNAGATGGRRRGKKRTAKKAGRRHKRRTMRGGRWTPANVNSAPAGYGFVSAEGFRGGIAPATGYQANVGGAPMNAAGVRTA